KENSTILNINAIGLQSGQTALHWAYKKNHIQLIRLLIEAGGDESCRDKEGKKPKEYIEAQEPLTLMLSHQTRTQNPENLIKILQSLPKAQRSEERRVGKEYRSRRKT